MTHDKEMFLLQRLEEIRDSQIRLETYQREANGRIGKAEQAIAVLQDRSDRHDKTSGRASLWGKSGLGAAIITALPYLKDLFFHSTK